MENWKEVPGFNGRYRVSDGGKIQNTETGKCLKPIKQGNGYYHVTLYGPSGAKQFRLHRIVAEAFCDKKPGCDVVNHIDNDPGNNAAENLEFVTQKQNIWHSVLQGRKADAINKAHEAARKATSKTVEGTETATGERKVYCPISAVSVDGFDHSCVSKCCLGKLRQHKGHTWRYVNA